MIDDNNFRKIVLDMMYHPEAYSKEDYYEAFLEMTGRYLNEMVTTINLENVIRIRTSLMRPTPLSATCREPSRTFCPIWQASKEAALTPASMHMVMRDSTRRGMTTTWQDKLHLQAEHEGCVSSLRQPFLCLGIQGSELFQVLVSYDSFTSLPVMCSGVSSRH